MKEKHTCGGPRFGRLAPYGTCPRCDELHRGAEPRRGWGSRASTTNLDAYCFCGHSNLWDERCPVCGKRPYTD